MSPGLLSSKDPVLLFLLARRALFFELSSFAVAGVGHPGHFEVWNVVLRCLAWRVQDIGHLFIRVAGVALSGRC